MSKICPSCSRETEEDVQFCPFCAAFVGTTEQEEISAPCFNAKSIIIVIVALAVLASTALALFVFDLFGLNGNDDASHIGSGRPLFAMGLSPVSQNGLWGYINKQGEFEIQPAYSAALSFNDDLNALAGAAADGSFGFINADGEFAVAANYRIIADFAPNGIALAYTKEDGYFYINSSGRRMFDRTFADADGFNDSGYAQASEYVDGTLTDIIIASDGSTVFSAGDNLSLGELHGKYFTARYDYGDRIAYRLYNFDVNNMLDASAPYPEECDRIAFYNDLVMFFTLSDKAGYYEVTVARIDGIVYDELRSGLYADYSYIPSVLGLILYEEDGGRPVKEVFDENMNRLYSEKDGGEIISAPDKSGIFCVKEKGKYSAYSADGKLFESGYPFGIFNCGLAPYLGEDMRIGYINVSGETVIQPQYSYATDFSADGFAYVLSDGGYALINTEGNVIVDGLDYAYPDMFYSDTDLTGYTVRDFDGHKDDVNLFDNGRVEVRLNDEEVPELGSYGENHLYSTDGKPLYDTAEFRYIGIDNSITYLMKNVFSYDNEAGYYTLHPGVYLPEASRMGNYSGSINHAGVYENETYPLDSQFDYAMYDVYANMTFRPLDVTYADRRLGRESSSTASTLYYEAAEIFVVVYLSENFFEDRNSIVRIYDKKMNRIGGYTVHTDSNGPYYFESACEGIMLFPVEDGEDYVIYSTVDILTGREQNSVKTYDYPGKYTEDFIFMDHDFGNSKYDPTNRKAVSRIGAEITDVTVAGKSDNYAGSGLISVKLPDGGYGYADIYGTVYGDYKRITAFSDDGYAAVLKDDGKYYCIDTEFNELFSSEYEFLAPQNGYALYYDVESGRLGYLDMDGNIAQSAIYDTATDFYSDGYAVVHDSASGKLLVVDKEFNTVMTAEDISTDGSVSNIGAKEHHTGYDFYGVKEHYEKYARMVDGELFECGLLFSGSVGRDKYGNYIQFGRGIDLDEYSNSALVTDDPDSIYTSGSLRYIAKLSDGSYGIIASVGEDNGYGFTINKKYGIIDLNGEFIIPPEYDDITVTGSGDLLVMNGWDNQESGALTYARKLIRPDGSEIELEHEGKIIDDLGVGYMVRTDEPLHDTTAPFTTLYTYSGKKIYKTLTGGLEPDYYGLNSVGKYISFVSNDCVGYLIDAETGETVISKKDCVGVRITGSKYEEGTAIAAGFVTYAGNDLWHYAGYIIDDGEILYEDEGTEYNYIMLCTDELAIVGNLDEDKFRVLNYRTGKMTEQEFCIMSTVQISSEQETFGNYLRYNKISGAVMIWNEEITYREFTYDVENTEYYVVDKDLNVTSLGALDYSFDIETTPVYTGGMYIVPLDTGTNGMPCLVYADKDGNILDEHALKHEYSRISRFTPDGYSVAIVSDTDECIVINTNGEKVFALNSYDVMNYGTDVMKFYSAGGTISGSVSAGILIGLWYDVADAIEPFAMTDNYDLMKKYTYITKNIRFDNYNINGSINPDY
ncbi:MAG: WG repeat-containing protein [Eubacterium sp.]|nr:WG repeat-containing protein [Eubacterium sp.]